TQFYFCNIRKIGYPLQKILQGFIMKNVRKLIKMWRKRSIKKGVVGMVSLITSLLSLLFMPVILILLVLVALAFKLFLYVGGIYMVLAVILMLWIEDAKVYPLTLYQGIAVCIAIGVITLFLRFHAYFKLRRFRQNHY